MEASNKTFNAPENFSMPERMRMHFRKKYGTQKEAAKVFGVSDAMISGVVVGRFQPSASMLKDMQDEAAKV